MWIFQSTSNTRAVLKDSIKYIRSDVPTAASESERMWLLSNDVTMVLDLRTDSERAAKPCPLMDDGRFSYHCVPVTGGDKVPRSVDDVPKSYIGMADAQLENIIELLLKSGSNVLYFCNAGKDRTGVVSAVLLHKLGFSVEYIVDDYMQSKANLQTMLNNFAMQNPAIDIEIITPRRQNIEKFLEWYIENEKAKES